MEQQVSELNALICGAFSYSSDKADRYVFHLVMLGYSACERISYALADSDWLFELKEVLRDTRPSLLRNHAEGLFSIYCKYLTPTLKYLNLSLLYEPNFPERKNLLRFQNIDWPVFQQKYPC